MMEASARILKQYYGYDTFREGQETVISAIVTDKRDTLAVMPTGGGKSLCYQIPAMMLGGITIVISPLISLMKDQVNALTRMGIPAAFLNSSLTASQNRAALSNARRGRYKLIYVAPERIFSEDFFDFATSTDISLIAVDEAHCVSQWGQDFRESYLTISDFISRLSTRPVVASFTATATPRVRADIQRLLKLESPFVLTTGFNRENLFFSVKESVNKYYDLLAQLREMQGLSGIIYCSTRETVENLQNQLCGAGYRATRYHAGLGDDERRKNQESFIIDENPIMVATNAFGMGIDKPNVAFVIHYNMPKDIESYYQEAGRAGRDGSEARCSLLYNKRDIVLCKFFIDKNYNENDTLDNETREQVYIAAKARLKAMIDYASSGTCLRKRILAYFGDKMEGGCTGCSICYGDYASVDITTNAQKVLSCVKRTGERFGVDMIAHILHGDANERISFLGLDKLTTFGIMSDETLVWIRKLIDALISKECLARTQDEFPILKLNELSVAILLGRERIKVREDVVSIATPKAQRRDARDKLKSAVQNQKSVPSSNEKLYDSLKELRTKLSDEEGVPAYVVFANSTLIEMCENLPQSRDEMLGISGIGYIKYERYGEKFLKVIRKYLSEDNE